MSCSLQPPAKLKPISDNYLQFYIVNISVKHTEFHSVNKIKLYFALP